jgi:hypothetical protein
MKEIWKNIAGYHNLYMISNKGKIKRLAGSLRCKTDRILKLNKHRDGHLLIKVCKNGKYESFFVHRLVLETFISPCPPGMECRHLDGNPENNKLNNLKWGTRSENVKDSIKHKTRVQPNGIKITFNGKTQSLINWANECCINYPSLWARIYKKGWGIEKALTTPVKIYEKRIKRTK